MNIKTKYPNKENVKYLTYSALTLTVRHVRIYNIKISTSI